MVQVSDMKNKTLSTAKKLSSLSPCVDRPPALWKRKFCLDCSRQLGLTAAVRLRDARFRVRETPHLDRLSRSFRRYSQSVRRLATVSNGDEPFVQFPGMINLSWQSATANPDAWGPLDEYNERIHTGQLRDDEHQRGTIRSKEPLNQPPAWFLQSFSHRANPSRPSRHAYWVSRSKGWTPKSWVSPTPPELPFRFSIPSSEASKAVDQDTLESSKGSLHVRGCR